MDDTPNATRDRILWALVIGLFLLRVPFLGGMRYLTWMSTSRWVTPMFEVGTYLLTAILIWSERDRLPAHHVDRLAVLILTLGKPLELLFSRMHSPIGRPLGSTWYLLYLPIAAVLGAGLCRARPKLARLGAKSGAWIVTGVLTGVIVGTFSGWCWLARMAPHAVPGPSVPWNLWILLPVQQMLYAGIAEEPFFRGFLWGALRRRGWNETWIWIAQAALFWSAHIYWLGRSPVSFWVIVPLGGLVFGWLAWRSRSIAVSMIAHGFVNGVLEIVISYRVLL